MPVLIGTMLFMTTSFAVVIAQTSPPDPSTATCPLTNIEEATGFIAAAPSGPIRVRLCPLGPILDDGNLLIDISTRSSVSSPDHLEGNVWTDAGAAIVEGGSWSADMPSGGTDARQATVHLPSSGVYRIGVRVTSTIANFTDENFFYVDLDATPATWAWTDPRTPPPEPHVAEPEMPPPSEDEVVALGSVSPSSPCTSRSDGKISVRVTFRVDNWGPVPQYVGGVWTAGYDSSYDDKPARWSYVQMYDREWNGDYFMGDGYANSNGYIEFTMVNDDGWNQGTLDPSINLVSRARYPGHSDDIAWVRSPVHIYNPLFGYKVDLKDSAGRLDNWPSQTCYYTIRPASANEAAPHYILSRMTAAYEKTWLSSSIDPHRVNVFWYQGVEASCGTCYTRASGEDNAIHVAATDARQDQWDVDVLAHEYGHHVMYDGAYQGQWPRYTGGSHYMTQCLHFHFAWTEGFADFFEAAAQWVNDGKQISRPNYQDVYYGGSGPYWGIDSAYEGWHGSTVEGDCPNPGDNQATELSVASTLWDIFDTANDNNPPAGSDDLGLDLDEILERLRYHREADSPVTVIENLYELHTGWDARFGHATNNIHNIYSDHEFRT